MKVLGIIFAVICVIAIAIATVITGGAALGILLALADITIRVIIAIAIISWAFRYVFRLFSRR